MEITSSGVSVYEVMLNLNHWEGLMSNEVPGFNQNLIAFMPTTAGHKCMSGKPGGFHAELKKGTNFGHVVEHVLLELIHLANPHQPDFSGWTKSLGGGHYVIHYGAPDLLTGRLAAILAVEIVGKLQQGKAPNLEMYVEQVRHPMEYFTDERARQLDLYDGVDPETVAVSRDPVPSLSDWQRDNLSRILCSVDVDFTQVNKSWRRAFGNFGGEFALGIMDKVELVNPDRALSDLESDEFKSYFQGVTNICQMMHAMRIPLNFVTHASWLYKNFLQVVILESICRTDDDRKSTIWDLDAFYQNVFHSIMAGYTQPVRLEADEDQLMLCGFRARHARQGAVLVVDDDTMARKAARNILEYNGIPTQGASEGIEALGILAGDGASIEVVLLDMIMPGMSGQAVCRRIREGYPKTRIILCSGFPLAGKDHYCLEEHAVSFLQKPFRTKTLVNLVRELMDCDVTGEGAQNHHAGLPENPPAIT